ncbi:hypothetical protein F5X68DRAFT_232197 [Plectosphaerella plurivora]|uniref:NADAR domain-containing protein n=1 Tax=Plectosphaerella plurivora TaxID=936078 RepID=A0A9P8V9R1_9PEZI|nr:hypothetical protein F5X68DRAFT_232197 [Plectosphaerella plurivora]
MGKSHGKQPSKGTKSSSRNNNAGKPSAPSFHHPSTPAIFFFKDDELPYGCFCQWYRCSFRDPESGLEFSSAEQWMMWNKAKMADDKASMREIMKTSSPLEQKNMGRDVKGFEPAEWDKVKFDVVVKGNMMKFTQGDDGAYSKSTATFDNGEEPTPRPLREILMASGDKYLCEALHFDRVWGIGYSEAEAGKMSRSKWGENLLGQALCVVRDRLRGEEAETET